MIVIYSAQQSQKITINSCYRPSLPCGSRRSFIQTYLLENTGHNAEQAVVLLSLPINKYMPEVNTVNGFPGLWALQEGLWILCQYAQSSPVCSVQPRVAQWKTSDLQHLVNLNVGMRRTNKAYSEAFSMGKHIGILLNVKIYIKGDNR